MSEERIETTKGFLTAELWHVSAYIPMEFNNNFHVPVKGKDDIQQLRDALNDVTDGYYISPGGDGCNFHTAIDTDGSCILTYKGTYRHNFNTSVALTEAGRLRLVELLDAAIAQAFTPEQIEEEETIHREWEAARIKRVEESKSWLDRLFGC